VVIAQGLGREVIEAAEEGGDLLLADLGEGRAATEEGLEAAECGVIVPHSVPRQPPGVGGYRVTFDGSRESDAVTNHGSSGSRSPVPIMRKQYRQFLERFFDPEGKGTV